MKSRVLHTNSQTFNTNEPGWRAPFNSLLFINYDTTVGSRVVINDNIILGPAIIVTDKAGDKISPSTFQISLNENEICRQPFKFVFKNTAAPLLVLSWTFYADEGTL